MAEESRLVIVIDSKNAERNAMNLGKELDSIEKKGDFASKSMDGLSVATRSLAGHMAGLVTVGAAVARMDAYTGMQNRLKLVTSSQQDLNKAMGDTFAIAQKSFQSWDSVIQVYQRFSDNAKTLGINMQQTAALTETVSKAVAISGASTQASEAALTQFGQALASGTLRGEELNSILEQTPALAKAIAQGMGITVGQLRSVAAEGKITGDVLVDALTKSKDSVDELFSKTDVTIGQSLTLLNNEVTKFVGEAGQASGAASLMASSIKLLGENLSTIADAAVLGGVAYLTKAIVTQTTAIYGSVTATAAQRVATVAQQQAAIAAATATLNEAKAHLANIQATNAETQAKFGATAAAARYKLASDAVTQALVAQAAAQGASNTAASIASRAFGLIGGPIGAITLGVTALAAGYMYMQSRTAEATAKLEEQAQVANKTKEELLALEGAQRKSAQADLASAFESQNKALNDLNQQFNSAVIAIQNYAVKNQVGYESLEKIRDISNKVRQGLISQEDAIKQINSLYFVTPDQINQVTDLNGKYEEQRVKTQNTANAQSVYGDKVTLAGNAASNAVGKVNDNSNALDGNADAARNAANAQSEYFKQLRQSTIQAMTTNKLIEKGFSPEKAQAYSEAVLKNNGKLSKDEAQLINQSLAEQAKLKSSIDSVASSKRASAKAGRDGASEAKKQAEEANRLAQEQFDLRESIYYKYADNAMKIEKDLQREIADIQKANFSPEQTAGYIENAKNRAALEKELYVAQLASDLNAWKETEEEKLTRKVKINELMIKLDSNMNDEFKNQALDSLIDQSNHELALIRLAKEERIFQMREAFLSETDAMVQRYELEKQKLIEINDVEERSYQEQLLRLKYQDEARKKLQTAQNEWSRTQAEMNGTSGFIAISDKQTEQTQQSQALFDSQMALAETAAERERIWKEHNDRMIRIDAYASEQRRQVQMAWGASYISSTADVLKQVLGENSDAYKAMFAVQKAYAIAQVLMNAPSTYSNVYNSAAAIPLIGPYIAPVLAGGALALQLAQASMIGSVSFNPAGFKTGGYTGNGGVSDVAGVVHGQEYVLNAAATKRVGVDTLNSINSGGDIGSNVNITINVPQGYTATQSQDSNGNVTIDVVQNMIDQSWQQVSQPNSKQSRAIQQSFGIQPKR